MNLFDYWWIWDMLASEPVTDTLSILAGYVSFCVVIVTALLAASPALWLARRGAHYERVRRGVIGVAILFAVLAFTVAMFQVHDLLNIYQSWYQTPSDPNWQPITPENWMLRPNG